MRLPMIGHRGRVPAPGGEWPPWPAARWPSLGVHISESSRVFFCVHRCFSLYINLTFGPSFYLFITPYRSRYSPKPVEFYECKPCIHMIVIFRSFLMFC